MTGTVPDELTEVQHAQLVAALHELKASLRLRLDDTSRTETVDLDLPIGRLSRMDAIQQQKMAQAEQAKAGLRLQAVEAALERAAEDEYGWCCQCGEPVGWPRLRARPETPFCVPCLEKLE